MTPVSRKAKFFAQSCSLNLLPVPTQRHTSVPLKCLLNRGGCRCSKQSKCLKAWSSQAPASSRPLVRSGAGRMVRVSQCSSGPWRTLPRAPSAQQCRCLKEPGCKIACECRCLEQAKCPGLRAKFRWLGLNKALPKREDPTRVYPGAKAVADLASEIHSLFPAEIPKHLPVSQLLTA